MNKFDKFIKVFIIFMIGSVIYKGRRTNIDLCRW